jgi:TolB-like protein
MKRWFLGVLFSMVGLIGYAQQLPTVAVATFDVVGGITVDEAKVVTELFMTELVSRGTINVVDRANFDKIITEMKFQTSDWSNSQKTAQLGRALNAGFVVRGQLMKMGVNIYMTSTMLDINTAQVLYSARLQISDLSEVFDRLPDYCSQMLSKIPAPNYFIGTWDSGGIIKTKTGWRATSSINPFESTHGLETLSDDKLKEIIMYENGRCLITTQSNEKIEGTYTYDYTKPYFSLVAGNYKIEGKLFLNNEKNHCYVQIDTGSFVPSWGDYNTYYNGTFKTLLKRR